MSKSQIDSYTPPQMPMDANETKRAAILAKKQQIDNHVLKNYNTSDVSKIEGLQSEFFGQDEFIYIKQFFPKELIKQLVIPDVDRLHAHVNRSYIPIQKKGGSVSSYIVAKKGHIVNHLYHSRPFIDVLQKITKEERFFECPARDPHAVALYYYEEPGDHISWHYDSSFYKGKRFTVLVGMVDDHERESCKLLCHLYTRTQGAEVVKMAVTLEPGDLVMFNGDKLWHSVSPMTPTPNQKRVVLSLEYISDDGMSMMGKAMSNVKDAVTYFGVSSLLGYNGSGVDDDEEDDDGKKKPEKSGWSSFLPICGGWF